MEKNNRFLLGLCFFFLLTTFFSPCFSYADNEDVADLRKQVAELKAEIASLKKSPVTTSQNDPFNVWGSRSAATWDPFAEMQQMQDRMNRLFRDRFNQSGMLSAPGFYEPDLDVEDHESYYIMTLDLPGMDKDKININITDHDIVISGQRSYDSEEKNDQQGFYRIERQFGSFSRSLPLPHDASSEKVEASYEKGVLKIKIGKQENAPKKAEAKRITIS